MEAEGKIMHEKQDSGPRLNPDEKDIDVLRDSATKRFAAADARLAHGKAALANAGK